jgi:hypothetical protein
MADGGWSERALARDQIGIFYAPVGRPIDVPDQIGIPYILVGPVSTRRVS